MDKQIIQDQISGLIEQGKTLRQQEAIFLKMTGINEEIIKTNIDRENNKDNLVKAKESLKKLVSQKNDAVQESFKSIAEKMGQVLPVGKAVLNLDDGLFIGWEAGDDGVYTPYNGLSGGQKQMFDGALAHVLDSNIIVLEAAELDNDHMIAALEDLAGIDKQVIISTCHTVDVVPGEFVKISL
jgi:hypothetical protein